MTNSGDDLLLARFRCAPAAAPSAIEGFQRKTRRSLPEAYVQFLRRANGGEGFIGRAYLILWPIEDLAEKNAAYQVDQYAPGLFIFGSDGGGEAFAFDMRSATNTIVSVPFVGMKLDEARFIAEDFDAFLRRLRES